MLKISLFIMLILFLSGCYTSDVDDCLKRFDNRVHVMSPSKQVFKVLNKLKVSSICSESDYKTFYKQLDGIAEVLNDDEQNELYNILLFVEFHFNYNGGEYVDYLNKNNIKILKYYKNLINDNNFILKMNYSKEEINNLKSLNNILK